MHRITLAVVLASTVALAACGRDDSAEQSSTTTSTTSTTTTTTPAPAAAPATPATPPAASTAAPAAPAAPATATTVAANGADVYAKACAACHTAGVTGAPKPGDKADWAPRIAQGKDVLYQHAIQGYTGQKGVMPPKGGFANLSDDEVKAAVDHMVAQSS